MVNFVLFGCGVWGVSSFFFFLFVCVMVLVL